MITGLELDEGVYLSVFSSSCPRELGYVLSCRFPGWQGLGWGEPREGERLGQLPEGWSPALVDSSQRQVDRG